MFLNPARWLWPLSAAPLGLLAASEPGADGFRRKK
jgi:hypothetical protein